MSRYLRLIILLVVIVFNQEAMAINFPNNMDSVLNIYRNNGQLEESIIYIEKLLLKAKKEYGNQKNTFAFYLQYKAEINSELGNYEEALIDFKTTLKIYEKNHSSTSPELVETLTSLGDIYFELSDYPLAKEHLTRALDIKRKELPFSPIDCAYIYNRLFYVYEATAEYSKGLELSKKALKLQLESDKKDYHELINSYAGIASSYKKMNRYEDAVSIEKKALHLQQKHFPSTDPLLAHRFNNLAILYSLMHRKNEALPYYQKALEIVKNNKNPNHPQIAIHLNNLAGCHRDLKQFKIAEKILLQAVSIFKESFGEEHPNTIAFINNIGGLYEEMKNFEKAKGYYLQAVTLSNKVLGKEHSYSILFKRNLACSHQYLGNYHKALKLHFEVLKSHQILFGETNKKVFSSYNNIAECYLLLGPDFYDKGLDWIEKSIRLNAIEPIEIKEFGNDLYTLSHRTFKSNTQFRKALKVLSKLQEAIYYVTHNKQFLLDSYKSQKTLAYFIQQQQNTVYTKKDKLKIVGYSTHASSRAIGLIEALIEVNDPLIVSEAIVFAEYNKSAILSSALQGNQAFDFGGIPDSLKTQEKTLKKELSSVKKKIIQATTAQHKEDLTIAKDELISIQLAQDKLRSLLEKKYPKYNALKNEQKILTTSIIQDELLEDGSALLEYCVYDSSVYVIVITKTSTHLQRLPIDKKELRSQIKNFRKSLSNYNFILNNQNKALSLYTRMAYSLHQVLIAPIKAHLTNIKHLVIVPDNDLGHIPFEALLSTLTEQKEPNYKTLNYLLTDYRISYSYSASLSLENKHYQRGQNNGKILGFAATYNPKDSILTERSPSNIKLRQTLQGLPAAIKEVKSLQNQFKNNDFFFGEKATEANFKQHAANYSILHLAMHGIVNHHHPLLSSLAFTEDHSKVENNFLEAHEISNLQLNNDLVILSACKTGYGEFEQGEGIVSLARSFMYAGTPSLVVSLWEVNDVSTATIMQLFYHYLKDGMTKDEALRQAKLDFIQKSDGIITHPAFWSPFILLGDNQAITLHQTSFLWMWQGLGLIALASIVLFYFKNKFSKKEQN
jgi:CHAT domain-containing protein/tetratricopeptide (TPR) repeat protein